jgi:predicted  nucleic acid-binding Zn-ribbon protein
MIGPDDDEAALRRLNLVDRLTKRIKTQAAEIESLCARLATAERERDEARAAIDLLGGAQENLQKQIIELRKATPHDPRRTDRQG